MCVHACACVRAITCLCACLFVHVSMLVCVDLGYVSFVWVLVCLRVCGCECCVASTYPLFQQIDNLRVGDRHRGVLEVLYSVHQPHVQRRVATDGVWLAHRTCESREEDMFKLLIRRTINCTTEFANTDIRTEKRMPGIEVPMSIIINCERSKV